MKKSGLFRALAVVALGCWGLATPPMADAASMNICYSCMVSDVCPNETVANIICADMGGDVCPEFNECYELDPMCSGWPVSTVLITCRART